MILTLRNSTSVQIAINSTVRVGISATPTRLYCLHIISGASAGSVVFHDGISTVTNQYGTSIGTANTGRTFTFGFDGLYFPDGLAMFANTNCTSVLVTYGQ